VSNPNVSVLRSPFAFRVLAGSLIGRLPSGSAPLALLLFARETMSIAVAGLLVGAYTAGVAIGQPLLARMADRWRQPPVLWGGAAASTAGFLATAAHPALPGTLGAALLAGLGAPPFEACLRALWRDIVAEDLVQTAYTLDVTSQELIFVVGPMVTLGAIAAFGAAGGLYATAAVQLLGTAIFATTPAVGRWRGEHAPRHWAGPLRSPGIRRLLVTILLVGLAVGSLPVAVTAYAERAGTPSWSGWLLAANALGALLGGLLYTRFRAALPAGVALITLGLGLLYVPPLLTPPPPAMLALIVATGIGLPPLLTVVFLEVDTVAPAGTAAESFAWVATAFSVGAAVGAAVNGAILDHVGPPRAGFAVAPIVLALAALFATLTARPTASPPPA
jgi:predicted MFS family arabinose efflux permease